MKKRKFALGGAASQGFSIAPKVAPKPVVAKPAAPLPVAQKAPAPTVAAKPVIPPKAPAPTVAAKPVSRPVVGPGLQDAAPDPAYAADYVAKRMAEQKAMEPPPLPPNTFQQMNSILYGKTYNPSEYFGGFKKGGRVKAKASGGSVSSASKRADGIAQRGKTKFKVY
jgi:hypothetical protein